MHRRLHLLLIILFVVTNSQAHAEVVPTDNDLRAAYCLGVLIQQRDVTDAMLKDGSSDNDETLKALHGKYLKRANGEINRLQAYLVSKGYIGSSDDSAFIAVAVPLQRGKNDVTTCLSEVTQCSMQCADKEEKQSGASTFQECVEACNPNREQCNKTKGCKDLSFLPF